MPKPKCPRCGANKAKGGPIVFQCGGCGGYFDDDPDEGGTYSNRPDGRLLRDEAARERPLEQLSGRRLPNR